jgi:hypothetical protein
MVHPSNHRRNHYDCKATWDYTKEALLLWLWRRGMHRLRESVVFFDSVQTLYENLGEYLDKP